MAKRIGKLAVVLSADQSHFDKAMRAATSRVLVFGSVVRRSSSALSSNLMALGGVAAAALSVRSLLGTAYAIDRVAKASERLQVPVDKLMGLQHGAKLAGVSAEAFDAAFLTMIKNVELGARGLGRARTATDELGIDMKKLAALDSQNQFKVVAEAISRLEDKGHAASVAMRIFGDQGAALVPLFARGAAGVDAMQQEAEALGIALSAVDVSRVVIAKDELERVREVLGSVTNALVVELAPYVSAAAEQFLEWSRTGESWRDIVGGAVKWVAGGIAQMLDLLDYGRIAWNAVKITGSAVLLAMLKPTQLLIQGIAKLITMAENYLPKSLVDAARQADAFAKGLLDGIHEQAEEAANNISNIWTSESMASKTERFFKNLEARADEAARNMAANAPAHVPYRPEMFDSVVKDLGDDVSEEVQASIAEGIRDVSFGPNDLVRAGSAEAQAGGLRAYTAMLDRQVKEQIELARRQLKEQEAIARNTRRNPAEELEPEVIYDG